MSARNNKHTVSNSIGKKFSSPYFLIILAFLVGFCTHLLVSVIFAESRKDGQIHACVTPRLGLVRIVTDHEEYQQGRREKERKSNREDKNGCRENEQAITWNIQGPTGPQGPAGSDGAGTSGPTFPFICPECSIGNIGDRLAGKNLSNAILPLTIFEGTDLHSVNFSHAVLQESNLTNANLSNVNFENADLESAQLEGANTEGAIWKNTICPDGTNSDANGGTCQGHFGQSEESEE